MIDVVARVPVIRGNTGIMSRVGETLSAYQHTIGIDGGFLSASIELKTNPIQAAAWVQDGVGQHIVSSFGGLVVWEGFVDSVEVTIGQSTISRGPLLDVVNKARVTWQKYTFGGLIGGGQYVTDFAVDEAARIGFFTLEGDVSGGTLVSEEEATNIRDLYLKEYSRPQTRTDFGGLGDVTVRLVCEGYYRLLEKYYYLRNVDADIEATEKIKDVLNAEPNGVVNGSKGVFETIGVTVNEYEDWSRTGSDIIFELVALGTSDNRRLSFGIWEDRIPRLVAVDPEIRYEMSAGFNGSLITMRNGGPIPVELVRPGYWIRTRSLPMSARSGNNENLRMSERDVLIEQVTFQAPNQLSINGGAFDTFAQRLARFNFGLV